MKTAKSNADVAGLERWLQSADKPIDVQDWRLDGLDLWPVLKTTILSLGILIQIGQRRWATTMGGPAWRAGVLLDHFLVSGLRRLTSPLRRFNYPSDALTGAILYHGSRVHARDIGGIMVTPPLDVPAILLGRAGHRAVFWFEDLEGGDPRLRRALHEPARGVAGVLRAAATRAWRVGTAARLARLPNFKTWCAGAASYLALSPRFLRLWLARQVDLTVATAQCYGEVFDNCGRPDLLVVLNSGFSSTAGLIAAASSRGIPTIEVHHGVESEAAITAPHQKPHFSVFNTAPRALVSWENVPRPDPRVFCTGPIGLHLPSLVLDRHRGDLRSYAALAQIFQQQASALERHAQLAGATREILVSLQPGDGGEWIARIARQLPDDVLLWVRRHGSDAGRPVPRPSGLDLARCEFTLATASSLPLLLTRVHAHLTRFSAVTLEAAGMRVPTVAIELYAGSLFRHLVPQNLLVVETDIAKAANNLRKLIDSPMDRYGSDRPHLDRLIHFFEEHMAKAS